MTSIRGNEEEGLPVPESKYLARWKLERFWQENRWIDVPTVFPPPANRQPIEHDYHLVYEILQRHPDLAAEKFGGSSATEGELPIEFLERNNARKVFPLTHMLAAKAPLAVVNEVFAMYPNAVREKAGKEKDLPIHMACRLGLDFDVVHFLLSKFKEGASEEDWVGQLPIYLALNYRDRWAVPEEAFKIIEMLIRQHPQGVMRWNQYGHCAIAFSVRVGIPDNIVALMHQQIPDNFDHVFFGVELVDLDHWSIQNFHSLVNKIRPIQNGSEDGTRGDYNLHLMSCNCTDGTLTDIFNSISSPLSVLLEDCVLESRVLTENSEIAPANNEWSQSQVAKLSILRCDSDSDSCFPWLLEAVQSMPNLKTLQLSTQLFAIDATAIDVTEVLIGLLQTTRLEHLLIVEYEVNEERLIQLLKDSYVATHIEYKRLRYWPRDMKIIYFSALNRHGRARINQPNVTVHFLINCLVGVQRDAKLDETVKSQVLFFLLQQSPNLWAVA